MYKTEGGDELCQLIVRKKVGTHGIGARIAHYGLLQIIKK